MDPDPLTVEEDVVEGQIGLWMQQAAATMPYWKVGVAMALAVFAFGCIAFWLAAVEE